jgi:hypothetical protein
VVLGAVVAPGTVVVVVVSGGAGAGGSRPTTIVTLWPGRSWVPASGN